MFFQVYGANALAQWGMLLVVLLGLILLNEFARRTKAGGAIMFFVIPALLTVYFVAIAIGAANGSEWALKNQTHLYMNGWFHYAKLYAALTGCIGFMMIKYKWGSVPSIGSSRSRSSSWQSTSSSRWLPISSLPSRDGTAGGSPVKVCVSMAAGTMS